MRISTASLGLYLLALLCAETVSASEEPTKVTRLAPYTDDWNCEIPAPMEGYLCFTLDGTEKIDPTKVKLRIDGTAIDVKPRVVESSRIVIFPLLFDVGNSDEAKRLNKEMWSRLLGSPFAMTQVINVPFDIEFAGRIIMSGTEDEPAQPAFQLLRYEREWMLFGFAAAMAVIAGVLSMSIQSSALRNRSPVPQIAVSDLPFSLGKLQMSIWFCLIFASFVFIWAVTGELKSLNSETFILLGISAGTSLAAIMVEKSKESPAAAVEEQLSAAGIKDAQDAKRLKALIKSGKGGHDARDHFNVAAGQNGEPSLLTLSQLYKSYLELTAAYRSQGFFRDMVNDATGATVHRFQMLAWTIILGAIYIFRVYWDLQMPEFGTNLLALMGISGGIYLGFKVPER